MKLLLLLFLFVWISVVIVVGHPQIESLEDSPIQLAPFDVSQSQDSLDRTLFSDDSGNGLDRSSSPSFGRAALDLTSLNDEQDFDEALQPLDLTMEQDSLFPPTELFADSDIRCSPDDENVSLFGKRRRDSNACSAPPSGVENLGPSKNRPPEPNDMKSLGFESNEELQNLFSFKDDYEMCPIEVFQLSTIPVCEYFGQTTIIRTLGIEDVILFDIGLASSDCQGEAGKIWCCQRVDFETRPSPILNSDQVNGISQQPQFMAEPLMFQMFLRVNNVKYDGYVCYPQSRNNIGPPFSRRPL